jgi:hypothetical protein
MDRDQAIAFALSCRPETIGVARLCQELLADVAGRPVAVPTPQLLPVCPRRAFGSPGPVGKVNNPWGRAGKPK